MKQSRLAGPSKEHLHVSSVESLYILCSKQKPDNRHQQVFISPLWHTEECCALSPTQVTYTPAQQHS